MVKEEHLVPEYYISKTAYCDDCNLELEDTGQILMSNPPYKVFQCKNCGKRYEIRESLLRGEWKWKEN